MNLYKIFAKYVVPSVLAFALSGVYAIVDGFFVGQSMGDAGLSAINIAFPVAALIQSLGTGIGMGGAVIWSVKRGSGDTESANRYIRAALYLLLFAGIVMTAFIFITEPILRLFGAEGDVLALGKDYLDVIVLGAAFQIFATGIVPIIRNNGGSVFAFITMMSGFAANILLDYLFVWVLHRGTEGAAIATILGQAITAIEAFAYLLFKKLPRFGSFASFGKCAARIAKVGIAPFGLTLSPMISLMLINRFCMMHGGEAAVACYACIAYAMTIAQMLIQGVGDGSQPLMSQYYGQGQLLTSGKIKKIAYAAAGILAALCCLILFFARHAVGPLFGSSASVGEDVAQVLPIFLIGLLFYAFSRITTAGFYATEKTAFSYLCVYAEPLLMLVLLFILPLFMGQAGVWWSAVSAQILTAGIALLLLIVSRKNDRVNSSVKEAV